MVLSEETAILVVRAIRQVDAQREELDSVSKNLHHALEAGGFTWDAAVALERAGISWDAHDATDRETNKSPVDASSPAAAAAAESKPDLTSHVVQKRPEGLALLRKMFDEYPGEDLPATFIRDWLVAHGWRTRSPRAVNVVHSMLSRMQTEGVERVGRGVYRKRLPNNDAAVVAAQPLSSSGEI